MLQSALLALRSADAHVPALAPLVALAFLATGLVLVGAAVGSGAACAAGRAAPSKVLGGGALAVASVYAPFLVAAALLSRDRTLSPGERKYFCEMDCHLAYDVTAAADAGIGRRAVTLRTWFDPT